MAKSQMATVAMRRMIGQHPRAGLGGESAVAGLALERAADADRMKPVHAEGEPQHQERDDDRARGDLAGQGAERGGGADGRGGAAGGRLGGVERVAGDVFRAEHGARTSRTRAARRQVPRPLAACAPRKSSAGILRSGIERVPCGPHARVDKSPQSRAQRGRERFERGAFVRAAPCFRLARLARLGGLRRGGGAARLRGACAARAGRPRRRARQSASARRARRCCAGRPGFG